MRVAIIGAGISGLATAFYLQQAKPDWRLTLYDGQDRPGGTMRTVEKDGFHFEAGGNGFLTNKPDTLELVKACGAEHLLVESSDLARKRYIFTDQLHRLPESPPLFFKSKLLSLSQKLRVAGEVFVKAKRDDSDESLYDFGCRRVGKAFTEVFLDAMVAGIYATTPDKVSVHAAFPLVVMLEREYGGLFRGMLKRRKKQAGPGGKLMSFQHGVSTFIEHLHQTIQADWRLGEPVRAVSKVGQGYRVERDADQDEFDQVILSAPAYATAGMVRGLGAGIADALAAIDYSPIAVVGMGFKQLEHPLDGFGLLTTTAAQQPILGVLWDSSIFPGRAPEGAKSVRVMIGGQRSPELVDQDEAGLIATARTGLANTMGIDQAPDVTFVSRWDRGIPSYPVGHLAHVKGLLDRLQAYPGLHLNNNAYQGIAMNDCVRNARELAERLAGK